MRHLHALLLFAFISLPVSACTGSTGAGAGASATTTTTATCPEGPRECGSPGLAPCPQGSYCYAIDPCGDSPRCQPFPPACAATPTCACLVDANAMSLGSNFKCTGSGTSIYAYDSAGATECCP